MGFFGDWKRSRQARWQRSALADLAEQRKHEQRAKLIAKPDKSQAELLEMGLLESEASFGWNRLDPWRDLISRMLDFQSGGFGAGHITDHRNRKGADFPFFVSESDLSIYRDASRILVKTNPNAEGLLNGVRRYTIGSGATIRAVPKGMGTVEDAKAAQGIIDEVMRINQFASRQRSFVTRSMRDGEGWFRLFANASALPSIRFVWPEQIRRPPGYDDEEYSFGVKADPDDAETIEEFAVWPINSIDSEDWESVPAEEIVRSKLNVDEEVKRGLPDFYCETLDAFDLANDLARKMGIGSARQASIAYIREHMGSSRASVLAFNTADATYTKPDTWGGQDRKVKRDPDGAVIDTNENTQFKDSPYNAGIQGHLDVFQMLLRRPHAKYNAPEWLGTSHSQDVNFASSLTRESPFVLSIMETQDCYSGNFRDLFERVLAMAAIAGQIAGNILQLVEVKVTLPDPESRDALQESQRATIRLENGTTSPQRVAEEDGDEWDKVLADRKAAIAQGWTPPTGPPTGGGGSAGSEDGAGGKDESTSNAGPTNRIKAPSYNGSTN